MEKRKTASGIEHGLLTTLVNQVPKKKRFVNVDPKRKEELEKLVKYNSELVTVRYVNYRNQESGNRCVDYTAGAGEPLYCFKFIHDYVYTVPRGVVGIVNDEHRKRPRRADMLDEAGQPTQKDMPARRIDEFVAAVI